MPGPLLLLTKKRWMSRHHSDERSKQVDQQDAETHRCLPVVVIDQALAVSRENLHVSFDVAANREAVIELPGAATTLARSCPERKTPGTGPGALWP
jgi:hypothetical protein